MSDSGVEMLLQRILEALERIERELNKRPTITTFPVRAPYTQPTAQPDCGCPLYGTCMNTACPRRVQVTNSASGTDGVGWPD